MLPTLRCPQCGNFSSLNSKHAPGRKVRCAACGKDFLIELAEDLIRKPTLRMMGDDEGGGDWGGGHESAEEEDDDDEEEDGKKKKKKKKAGFFATIFGKIISFIVGIGVLSAACCCAVVIMFFFPGVPFVGEWEATVTKVAKIDLKDIAKGDKEKDTKDKDGKDKDAKDSKDKDAKDKDAKDPGDTDDVDFFMVKLKIAKTDDKTGTGVYTNEDGKALTFKYKDYDKEAKTVVFELDNKDEKFWKDIKSTAKFTFSVVGNELTLTADGQSMTFSKIMPAQPDKAPAKKGKKRR